MLNHTSCRSFQIAVCNIAIQLIGKLKHLQLWILSHDMLFFYSLIFESFKQYWSQAPLLLLYCIPYTAIVLCGVQFINLRLNQGDKLGLLAVPCLQCHSTPVEMTKPGKQARAIKKTVECITIKMPAILTSYHASIYSSSNFCRTGSDD